MSGERGLHSRAINKNEVDQHFQVMCEAFDLDLTLARPIYDADPYYSLSHKRALFDRDRIVSVLTVIPSMFRMAGGADVPVAAIAGVGTPPELRGRGYASQLIRDTMRQAPEEFGYPLAALVTDRPDYYARFGFATCSAMIDWEISPDALPCCGASEAVRVLSNLEYVAASLEIHRFQQHATEHIVGAFVRDHRRWSAFEMMTPRRKVAVWPDVAHIEAYLSHEEGGTDNSRTILVHEIVAPTENGRKAIIGFLSKQRDFDLVRGHVNRTEFAALGLASIDGVKASTNDGVMMRVLDFEDILSRIGQTGAFNSPLHDSDGLTLRANNAAVTKQNRPVRLFAVSDDEHEERIALCPADEMEGNWVALDVGPLTQLLTGYKSAGDLAEAGQLRSSSDEAVSLAEKLFPPCDPSLSTPDTF